MKTSTTARALVLGALIALVPAAAASAHITVNPDEQPKGSYTKLNFRVPNESDTASTNQVQIDFPEGLDIGWRVRPMPEWDVEVEQDGEAVTSITWSGSTIGPGEFEEFEVSGGPLPEDSDSLEFGAIQSYDDGEVVRWIEPVEEGEEEPEHPAPTLTLTAAEEEGGAGEETATGEAAAAVTDDDGGVDPLSVAAIVLALIGVGLGGAAFAKTRSS